MSFREQCESTWPCRRPGRRLRERPRTRASVQVSEWASGRLQLATCEAGWAARGLRLSLALWASGRVKTSSFPHAPARLSAVAGVGNLAEYSCVTLRPSRVSAPLHTVCFSSVWYLPPGQPEGVQETGKVRKLERELCQCRERCECRGRVIVREHTRCERASEAANDGVSWNGDEAFRSSARVCA